MIAALLLLLALGADPAPARGTPPPSPPATLADDSEARWVPFDLTPGNQIRFAMTLDDRPVTAILDTGVSDTVLSRTSPAVAGARLRSLGSATAIGGRVPISWMATRRLAFGGATRVGGGVVVTDLPAAATGDAQATDLLVGADLLGGHALDIDYAARRFRLLPTGRLPFRGSTAPLAISPRRGVFETTLGLGTQSLSPVLVDTGDGSAMTLASAVWARARPAGLSVTTAVAYGLAGVAVSELAIVPAVTLGALTAREVEVRVEPGGGFSDTIGAAGRIGTGFLGRYRVLLDPRAGHMILSPTPGADRPPLRSTSGLLVGILPDRLRVLHVMRGSPAEAGGWRTGDLICAIDGQPVTRDYPTSDLAQFTVASPGTATRLGDCTGAERTLVSRRFY